MHHFYGFEFLTRDIRYGPYHMDHFIIHGSYHEVGCVFLMVIWSEFRMEQYRDDDYRENALRFII